MTATGMGRLTGHNFRLCFVCKKSPTQDPTITSLRNKAETKILF
jgi:hypothetical protein